MYLSVKKITIIMGLYILVTMMILLLLFTKSFYDLKILQQTSFTQEEFALLKTPFEKTVDSPYEKALLNQYEKSFHTLQTKYESLLIEVLKDAKEEYKSLNKDTSIFALGNKYLALVHELELQADTEVKELLNQLSSELAAYNMDLSIIKEIQTYYTLYKRQQRAYLFEMVRNRL